MSTLQFPFHALAIIPTRDLNTAIRRRERAHVRIRAASQALRHSGEHTAPPRSAGRDDDGGLRSPAERFGSGGVRRVSRLGKIRTGNSEITGGAARSNLVRRGVGGLAGKGDLERHVTQGGRQLTDRVKSLELRFGKRAVGFAMNEEEEGFQGRFVL
jgi:hypothetical protein